MNTETKDETVMSDLTPEQSARDRAEAQAMFEAFVGRDNLPDLSDSGVRRWIDFRDYVLAAHECPTVPVWRPVTRDEIQAGWEIRSWRGNGSEAAWGVAHCQNRNGNWFTENYTLLTYDDAGWTYETPAPKPDPCVELLAKELHKEGECKELWPCSIAADSYRERARRILASLDNLKNGDWSSK